LIGGAIYFIKSIFIVPLINKIQENSMEASVFADSYGKVIRVVSDQIGFLMAKKYVGEDGKFDVSDVPALIGNLVPVILAFGDIKTLIDGKELFLKPEVEPLLQAAFEQNFKLPDARAEIVVEEMHNIIFSIVKVVVKISALKEAPIA
jgi:hypothetical protein